MPDVAGFRAKIGVLIPSTNTIVEADCSALHIPGVTFHTGRMYIAHHELGSDRAFEQLLAEINASLDIALRVVLTCEPDYLIMRISLRQSCGTSSKPQTGLTLMPSSSAGPICLWLAWLPRPKAG